MRLVQLGINTLINPDHISHITIRIQPGPEEIPEKWRHPYPVFMFTMYDGTIHEMPMPQDYYNEHYPFMPIDRFLRDLMDNKSYGG